MPTRPLNSVLCWPCWVFLLCKAQSLTGLGVYLWGELRSDCVKLEKIGPHACYQPHWKNDGFLPMLEGVVRARAAPPVTCSLQSQGVCVALGYLEHFPSDLRPKGRFTPPADIQTGAGCRKERAPYGVGQARAWGGPGKALSPGRNLARPPCPHWPVLTIPPAPVEPSVH